MDHVLTPSEANIISECRISDVAISDHYLITTKVDTSLKSCNPVRREYRQWNKLNLDEFRRRIRESNLFTSIELTTDALFKLMRSTVTAILDDLIPVRSRTIRIRKERNSWLSEEAVKAKRNRRNLERKWKLSGS